MPLSALSAHFILSHAVGLEIRGVAPAARPSSLNNNVSPGKQHLHGALRT